MENQMKVIGSPVVVEKNTLDIARRSGPVKYGGHVWTGYIERNGVRKAVGVKWQTR
jgi:hypothetical protein